MLSRDLGIEGFDAASWGSLLSLFDRRPDGAHSSAGATAARLRALLVVVTDREGRPRAAFASDSAAPAPDDLGSLDDLASLARRHRARRVIVAEQGVAEALVEAFRARVPLDADYATQCLEILAVVREWERAGRIRASPRFGRVSPWTTAALAHALDLVLPAGHSALLCAWEGDRVCTAAALRRGASGIDRIVGPERILEWAGPLSGDPQRDHRLLSQGVTLELAPVHVGLFGPRALLAELIGRAEPGAWASAVATREVVLHPMPAYGAALVTADTVRAAAAWAGRRAGELDLGALFEPLARGWQTRIRGLAEGARLEPLLTLLERWLHPGDDRAGSD